MRYRGFRTDYVTKVVSLKGSLRRVSAMWLRLAVVAVIVLRLSLSGSAQNVNSQYLDYIEKYAPLACEQQKKHGIPASITLAQGLLESRAGLSTLASEGNNHFGIKCHSTWTGPSMLRDDDAPDECFRVYSSAAESFDDHSRFLHGRRYSRLFDLDPSDYASWAYGLRECGYATDPNYGVKLISIIERYKLYSYDSGGGGGAAIDDDAEFILSQLKSAHVVRRARGLHYVIAVPGDTYASIGAELGVAGKTLASYNDAEGGANTPIKAWEEVYLQPKLDHAPKNVGKVTIGEDESAHSVAQRYGVTMKLIKELNPGFSDRPGTVLRLKR